MGVKTMLYRKVRGIRSDLDLTQEEFANILGMSLRSYRNKEKGDVSFTQTEMIKIMLYAQLSIEEAGLLFFSKQANQELYEKCDLDHFVNNSLRNR